VLSEDGQLLVQPQPLVVPKLAWQTGASLGEVQRAAGPADATTTKLYDRCGYNPEKLASFFASY
jgi:hypothetical protein